MKNWRWIDLFSAMRQMGLTNFQGWTGEQKTPENMGIIVMPASLKAMSNSTSNQVSKTMIEMGLGNDKNLPSFLLDAKSGVK